MQPMNLFQVIVVVLLALACIIMFLFSIEPWITDNYIKIKLYFIGKKASKILTEIAKKHENSDPELFKELNSLAEETKNIHKKKSL